MSDQNGKGLPDNLDLQILVGQTARKAIGEMPGCQFIEQLGGDRGTTYRLSFHTGEEFILSVLPKLKDEDPQGYARGSSLNPVTIRNEGATPDVTVSRMHVGVGRTAKTNKLLTVVLHRDDGRQILEHAILDEDRFVDALRLLFPHGELSGGCEAVVGGLLDWWNGFDDSDMEGNRLVQELEPVVADAQKALTKP